MLVKDGDIFGDGVNVAARLEGIADPGGICVTRGVRDHLRDRMQYTFEDLGEHRVKNIARPVRAFRVLFNADETTDLASETISAGELLSPSTATEAADTAKQLELAFWQSVEASGDPEEYEAYLKQYPDGTFVALAEARLTGSPASSPPPPDPTVELEFWNSIKDTDVRANFEAYLEKYQEGEFRSLAIRLAPPPDLGHGSNEK